MIDHESVAGTVAAALALQELDRMRAMECLPSPEALLDRLQARATDFHLLAGVVLAYLKRQGVPRG